MFYLLRVFSFEPQNLSIINTVLALPSVRSVIFPAWLPVASGKKIRFEEPIDYAFSLVPEVFHPKPGFRVPLSAENGNEFEITVYQEEMHNPSNIIISFEITKIKSGLVSLGKLKELIFEMVPVFKGIYASVYDPRVSNRPNGPKCFTGPRNKNLPSDLGWITFFGNELVDFIGGDRFSRLKSCSEKVPFNAGILIVLQEEPFMEDNPDHRKQQKRAQRELRLNYFQN
jgi:hypothetical protein